MVFKHGSKFATQNCGFKVMFIFQVIFQFNFMVSAICGLAYIDMAINFYINFFLTYLFMVIMCRNVVFHEIVNGEFITAPGDLVYGGDCGQPMMAGIN